MNLSSKREDGTFEHQAFEQGMDDYPLSHFLRWDTEAAGELNDVLTAFRADLKLDGEPAYLKLAQGVAGTVSLWYALGIAYAEGAKEVGG